MSSATQEILFGVTGQYLVLEVDRPLTSITSAAVWALSDDDTSTAETATTGSAAVDTATEATTAAAGSDQTDPRKLTVASSAGFVVGRRYYVSKAGLSEAFELARVDTDAALYARHPLVNAYASGATINGTLRATIAVDSTWVADLSNLTPTADPNPGYRVRWVVVYADTGETAVEFRNFDLVRYPSSPPVGPLDVDREFPGWIDQLPPDYRSSQGRPLIEEATRVVKMRLYRGGIADQALRNREAHAALVSAQAVCGMLEARALRGADVAQALDVAQKRVERMFASLIDSPRAALDLAGGGAATTTKGRGASLSVR